MFKLLRLATAKSTFLALVLSGPLAAADMGEGLPSFSPNISGGAAGANVAPVENVAPEGKTKIKGLANVEEDSYPSPLVNRPSLSQSLLGTVDVNLDQRSSILDSKVDMTVGRYVDWSESFLAVRELYTEKKFGSTGTTISIGRKLEYWSQLDQDWRMGEWQPNYNVDPLRPVAEGLTGIFVKQEIGQWEALFFISPIFIPTQNPDVETQNGSLVADSRWYRTPANSASILGQTTQIQYTLNVPDLGSLMANPGGGLRIGAGDRKDGFWGSANYGYKPINALQLKYDASLMAAQNTSPVTVVPVVNYANIWGVDFGYSTPTSRVSISYLEDDPVSQLPVNSGSTDWWQQQPGQLQMYSVHADTKMNSSLLREPFQVALDYLRVFEQTTWDLDSTGARVMQIFPYRTNFTNAVSAKAAVNSVLLNKKIITQVMALRDFDQRGNLFETAVSWRWSDWTWNAGVDVMSPDDNSDTNSDPRFINEFRANDRVYGGFNYAF